MANLEQFSVTSLSNGRFKVEAVVNPDEGESVDLTGANAIILPDHLNELFTIEELEQMYRNAIATQALYKKAGIS